MIPTEGEQVMTTDVSEANREKRRAAWVSVLAALLLTAVKLAVGLATNSLGILSEALHSGLDLLAAVMTLLAVRMSARPADASHPFGHGKVENLSALAETLLLFATCFWVVYEGAQRLMEGGSPVEPSVWGMGVMAFSAALDINRVRMLRKVAAKHKSQALEADALHFATDILSSLVVFAGVSAVWLADALHLSGPAARLLTQADTVAALVVAVIIFQASIRMARAAVDTLMDSGSAEERDAIRERVERVPGILSVRRIRQRTSGPDTFVDLVIGVDPHIRVASGHKLAHDAALAVEAVVPGADVTVHTEPVRACPRDSDPVAVITRLASQHAVSVHDIRIIRDNGRNVIELHVEVPGNEDFRTAHDRVHKFETHVAASLTPASIVSLIEPEGGLTETELSGEDDSLLRKAVSDTVARLVDEDPLITHPHRLDIHTLPLYGPCLSFHCEAAPHLTVREAHAITVRLERALRDALPALGRITIHMDPQDDPQ